MDLEHALRKASSHSPPFHIRRPFWRQFRMSLFPENDGTLTLIKPGEKSQWTASQEDQLATDWDIC